MAGSTNWGPNVSFQLNIDNLLDKIPLMKPAVCLLPCLFLVPPRRMFLGSVRVEF